MECIGDELCKNVIYQFVCYVKLERLLRTCEHCLSNVTYRLIDQFRFSQVKCETFGHSYLFFRFIIMVEAIPGEAPDYLRFR